MSTWYITRRERQHDVLSLKKDDGYLFSLKRERQIESGWFFIAYHEIYLNDWQLGNRKTKCRYKKAGLNMKVIHEIKSEEGRQEP